MLRKLNTVLPVVGLVLAFSFLLMFSTANSSVLHAEEVAVTVDFSQDQGPVGHYGSGFLHSVWPDAPDNDLVMPLKPVIWRGGWCAKSTLGLLETIQRINRDWTPGAECFISMSDFYVIHHEPYYDIVNSRFRMSFREVCMDVVRRVQAKGLKNVVYDILNEPDTPMGEIATGDGVISHDWKTMWDEGYEAIKAQDPQAQVAGPSFAGGVTGVRPWLLEQKTKHKLPDIVTWHFGNIETLEADISSLHAWMVGNGISDRPIVIGEYIWCDKNDPGQDVCIFAQAERSNTKMIHTTWTAKSSFEPWLTELCNRDPRTGRITKCSQWWAYKSYGDMSGTRVNAQSSDLSLADGLASKDPAAGTGSAIVLLGCREGLAEGQVTVTLQHLDSAPYLISAGKIRARIEKTIRDNNATERTAMTLVSDQKYAVADNSLTLTLNAVRGDAFKISLVKPAGGVFPAEPAYVPLPPYTGNLIPSGDFESGPINHYADVDIPVRNTLSWASPHAGSYYCRIGKGSVLSFWIGTRPNTTYHAKAYFKKNNAEDDIQMYVTVGGQIVGNRIERIPAGDTWNPYSIVFTTPADDTSKRACLFIVNPTHSASWLEVDDITCFIKGDGPPVAPAYIAGPPARPLPPAPLGEVPYGFEDDTPDKSGAPCEDRGFINGVWKGIDFGIGRWKFTNSEIGFPKPSFYAYFAEFSSTSESFNIPEGRVLKSITVASLVPGTYKTCSRGNPDVTGTIAANTSVKVVTGWTVPSKTITVTLPASVSRGLDERGQSGMDDIVYTEGTTGGPTAPLAP